MLFLRLRSEKLNRCQAPFILTGLQMQVNDGGGGCILMI